MEEVRTSYKKLALQYHPDKNKAEDATEKFQEIGSAYNAILKHLEGPSHGWAEGPPHSHFYGDNDNEYGYSYDDGYYEDDMDFLL